MRLLSAVLPAREKCETRRRPCAARATRIGAAGGRASRAETRGEQYRGGGPVSPLQIETDSAHGAIASPTRRSRSRYARASPRRRFDRHRSRSTTSRRPAGAQEPVMSIASKSPHSACCRALRTALAASTACLASAETTVSDGAGRPRAGCRPPMPHVPSTGDGRWKERRGRMIMG